MLEGTGSTSFFGSSFIWTPDNCVLILIILVEMAAGTPAAALYGEGYSAPIGYTGFPSRLYPTAAGNAAARQPQYRQAYLQSEAVLAARRASNEKYREYLAQCESDLRGLGDVILRALEAKTPYATNACERYAYYMAHKAQFDDMHRSDLDARQRAYFIQYAKQLQNIQRKKGIENPPLRKAPRNPLEVPAAIRELEEAIARESAPATAAPAVQPLPTIPSPGAVAAPPTKSWWSRTKNIASEAGSAVVAAGSAVAERAGYWAGIADSETFKGGARTRRNTRKAACRRKIRKTIKHMNKLFAKQHKVWITKQHIPRVEKEYIRACVKDTYPLY